MAEVIDQKETQTKRPKLGTLVWTAAVNERIAEDTLFAVWVIACLKRHARGDWGDLSAEDRQENDLALGKYLRIFSAYEHKSLPKIWIITEADRSATTVLFPEDY